MTDGSVSPVYGDPSAAPPPWAEVEQRIAAAQLYWLVTTRADGRPHAVPLCGLWRDGAFWFCTGDAEQKTRNLAAGRHVSVLAGPLGADGWATGKDISVEGEAVEVTDDALLQVLADGWAAKYDGDWRFEVRDHRFVELTRSGDGQGDGALVYRVAPTKVLVFGDQHGRVD